MLYKCDRCGYTGSQRSNLKHHLERKKICKPILSDISIENIAQNFNIYLKKTVPKIFQNGTKPVPKLEYFFDSKMEPKMEYIENFENSRSILESESLIKTPIFCFESAENRKGLHLEKNNSLMEYENLNSKMENFEKVEKNVKNGQNSGNLEKMKNDEKNEKNDENVSKFVEKNVKNDKKSQKKQISKKVKKSSKMGKKGKKMDEKFGKNEKKY